MDPVRTYPLAGPVTLVEATPFSDKCCKGLRVWGEFAYRQLYALALLVVAAVCWIFSQNQFEVFYSPLVIKATTRLV